MQSSIILLQAGGSNTSMMNMVLIVAIFVTFYFFMIRPQSKKAREQATFIEDLEKGDMVVTIGGIHGKITKVEETTVTVLVDTKTYLKIDKSAVSMDSTLSSRASSAES